MAFTDLISVTIGDPTKASTPNSLADNTEFNRDYADIDHNFDITTATGYHNGAYDAAFHLINTDGATSAATIFLDDSGDVWLKTALGTTTPPTPSGQTDGDGIFQIG